MDKTLILLRETLETMVHNINSKYGTNTWTPVHLGKHYSRGLRATHLTEKKIYDFFMEQQVKKSFF